jgi:hypothetical protein
MQAVSAADSVSLAIQRTRDLLFRPFRWGTYLKLGLVALLTEGIGTNFHSSTSHRTTTIHETSEYSAFYAPVHVTANQVALIVVAALAALVLAFVVCYLITRLRFAFFHCLVHNTNEIRPGWRLYRAQATRFFWLNVVVGFCYLLLAALIALPFVAGFWRVFHELPAGSQPGVWMILPLVLPLIPIIFLLVLAAILTDLVLRDFMLPHFALENATSGQAWSGAWTRLKAEKRQFFVYALLRLILPVIAMIGVFVVLLIPGVFLAAAVAAAEFAVHSAFADAAGAAAVTRILLEVFFGLLTGVFALLAGICLGGPLSTGIREYALSFYGGRYKVLGDILYPPPPSGTVPASA